MHVLGKYLATHWFAYMQITLFLNNVGAIFFFFFFKILYVYLRERENTSSGVRQSEREKQTPH